MTNVTVTKRKMILREMAKHNAHGTVSANAIRACASRHHLTDTQVRDLLVAAGYSCEVMTPPPVREIETKVVGVADILSPQEEALIRNGRLYKHMPDDDDNNTGGYVVARYDAFVREREAIIRILDAHKAARKQMEKALK